MVQKRTRASLLTGQPIVHPKKLSLSVKAVDQNGNGILYVQQRFTRNGKTTIKDRIFVGPQINGIMKRRAFKAETANFHKNFKAEKYKSLHQELFQHLEIYALQKVINYFFCKILQYQF